MSGKGILEIALKQSIFNHENGNLEEAEKGYLELIKENPDDEKLNFLLGTLYLQGGKPDVSSVFLGKSISQNPSDIRAINNLGLAYQSMGRYEDAIKLFNSAIKVDENYVSAYNNLGICYQLNGEYLKAVEVLKTSLTLNTNNSETNYNLGAVLHNQGLAEEALEYYLKAAEINPAYVEALYNIAVINIDKKEFEKAKLYLEQALEVVPDNFDVLVNLGFVNEQLMNLDTAEKNYNSALKLIPLSPEVNFNLGNIYKEQKIWGKAEHQYLNALKSKKEAQIYNNLGFVLHRQNKLEDALKNYKAALGIDKNYSDAKTNYGAVLLELGKIDEAVRQYNEVLENDNENATAHFNKAIALLLSGNLNEGWKEYEWRFKHGNLPKPCFTKPEWKGENLNGKTILVYDEQGVGDSIQFIRFLKLLKEQNAKVIFKCRKELIELYKNVESIDEIIELTQNYKSSYDYEISLLSLPGVFKVELETIPATCNYVKADAGLSEKWKNKLNTNGKLKVGLVWKGNPNHEYDYKRSCNLEDFKEILKNENVVFFSLQKENIKEEVKETTVIDLSKEINTFEDTAAIITNLDLLITVDTAVAHLAGVLGKETWVLLSKIPDWRWLINRDDSPWYSSIKLFRQKEAGKWDTVFEEVNNDLNRIVYENDDELLKEFLDKKIQAFQFHVNNELEKAEKIYLELLNIFNDDSELCFWLASLYNSQKNFTGAIKYFEAALKIKPDYPEVFEMFASAYEQVKDHKNALKFYEKILSQKNNDFKLLFKVGELQGILGNFETAEDYLRKAYHIDQTDFSLLNILGLVLQKRNKLPESREIFFKAVEISPLTAGVYLNIGNTYLFERKFEDALRNFDEAIKLDADLKGAHFAKAIVFLLNEKYELGWKEFIWSLVKPLNVSKNGSVPIWKPLPGKGETVFVYSEQGAGDIIHFSRYLPLIKELNYKVIFECPESLYNLFENSSFINELIIKEKTDHSKLNYDFYIPLLGLAGMFSTNTNNIPTCNNLLSLNSSEKDKILLNPDKINVGFAWSGNPKHGNDHNRSTKLKYFEQLFKNNSVDFYSLQQNKSEEVEEFSRRYNNVYDISNYDLYDTTGIITRLDLVITVDTSIAHLAGTVGKQTWTLLSYLPDWRWLLDRDDTPWYSSMKLFRQNTPGNWENVFDELGTELANFAAEKLKKNDNPENFKEELEEQKKYARRLLNENKVEEAKQLLQNVIKIEKSSGVYFDLAYCFHLQNNLPVALENYNKALGLNPKDYNALNNIGIIQKDLMRLDDAANSLLMSLKINKENPVALNNLGVIFDLKGDFPTAIELFQNAIKINGNYAEAFLNISNCYDILGKTDEALGAINRALEINPNYIDAHFNKSLMLLKERKFEEGLKEYEWRLKKEEYPVRNYGKPILDTKNLSGKKILVFDEQGYGDTLNFARYINELKKLGAEVHLECHAALAGLMKNCKGVDAVYERGLQDLRNIKHDYQVPLLSLPKFLNTIFENIPSEVPYINIDKKADQYWRGWFSEITKPKIGLVWEGRKPLYNTQRASSLEQFSVLTELRDIQFVSLQIGEAAKQNLILMKDYNIIDLSDVIKNFNDTAAIINNLDLVISVDTSVAHLAGAIGKKVWTLLSYKADWRWFKDTDESPWYPTMKLFRQKKFNDWQELLLRIKIQLQKELFNFSIK